MVSTVTDNLSRSHCADWVTPLNAAAQEYGVVGVVNKLPAGPKGRGKTRFDDGQAGSGLYLAWF
jgi:hypothetical protein